LGGPAGRGSFWGRLVDGARPALLAPLGGLALLAPADAVPVRVCVFAGSGASIADTREAVGGLAGFLERNGPFECRQQFLADAGGSDAAWSALTASDVAVLWVQSRQMGGLGRAAVRKFLERGGGMVVLGSGAGTWTDWPEFEPDVLGARYGAKFANGAPMRVINLYPHSIFTGVDHFETTQAMWRCDLGSDVQVIMEGTVGEDTVPMGWVCRHRGGRVACFQPGGRFLLGDPQFRGIISNSVLWAAKHPVPGARTLVQRTCMRDAYPGALAVSFPGGPSLCFDTVRGGINYIWDGDFVDLRPWWTARHGDPLRTFAARFSGDILYRERSLSPALHLGSGNDQSVFHFRGFRLGKDGCPELLYSVGGREITEELHPVIGGMGVECTFRVASGASPLWLRLEGGSSADIAVAGAARDGDYVRFDAAAAGVFDVTIRGRTGTDP